MVSKQFCYRALSGLERVVDTTLSFAYPDRILNRRGKSIVYPTRIQVQFAGLGRTGTTSLAAAMTILGYRVLHDDEAAAVLDLFGTYHEGIMSDDELHYQIGQRGFNCSFLWQDYEWAAQQDDIKVVLNGRDPVKWLDSWLVVSGFYDYLASRPFRWLPSVQNLLPQLHKSMKEIPTNGQPEKYMDRDTLIKGYHAHYDRVRAAVPPDRLLEYSVKDGWEPLCSFLGVPVPDVPFPHINDRFKIQVFMASLWLITWIWPLLFALLLILLYKLTDYLGGDLRIFLLPII